MGGGAKHEIRYQEIRSVNMADGLDTGSGEWFGLKSAHGSIGGSLVVAMSASAVRARIRRLSWALPPA